MYQATREKESEKVFQNTPRDGLTLNPLRISEMTKKCGCPFLLEANVVHFCDLSIYEKSCSQRQYLENCPIWLICTEEIHRLPRISKAIVSSAIFLKDYDFDFEKLDASLQEPDISRKTEKTRHFHDNGWRENRAFVLRLGRQS